MRAVIVALAWRLVLCGALAWLGWRYFGAVGLLAGGVVLAFVLPKPLVAFASELRHALRARVWRDVQGRHYAYRGRPLKVIEDVSHCRWVRAADVRAIVGYTASEGALALSYPNGFRRLGEPGEPYFSDEALHMHLGKETGATANHFRHWAEREISFPARRERERLGIRIGAPDAPRSD